MFKTKQKLLLLCLILILPGCGTIIGNGIWGDPTTATSSNIGIPPGADHISNAEFTEPVDEYNESTFTDCGSFTENSTVSQIDIGRQCIQSALDTCTPSRYLYNKENADTSRFVSFVSIKQYAEEPDECFIRVHTVSNVPSSYVGNKMNNPAASCEVSKTHSNKFS